MPKPKTVIRATLTQTFSCTPGNRCPYKPYYEAIGPDGRRIAGSSGKSEFISLLRRLYGPIELIVDDQRRNPNR